MNQLSHSIQEIRLSTDGMAIEPEPEATATPKNIMNTFCSWRRQIFPAYLSSFAWTRVSCLNSVPALFSLFHGTLHSCFVFLWTDSWLLWACSGFLFLLFPISIFTWLNEFPGKDTAFTWLCYDAQAAALAVFWYLWPELSCGKPSPGSRINTVVSDI